MALKEIAELFRKPLTKISFPKECEKHVYLYHQHFLKTNKSKQTKGLNQQNRKGHEPDLLRQKKKKGKKKKKASQTTQSTNVQSGKSPSAKTPSHNSDRGQISYNKSDGQSSSRVSVKTPVIEEDPGLALPVRKIEKTHKWPTLSRPGKERTNNLGSITPSHQATSPSRAGLTPFHDGVCQSSNIPLQNKQSHDLLGKLLQNKKFTPVISEKNDFTPERHHEKIDVSHDTDEPLPPGVEPDEVECEIKVDSNVNKHENHPGGGLDVMNVKLSDLILNEVKGKKLPLEMKKEESFTEEDNTSIKPSSEDKKNKSQPWDDEEQKPWELYDEPCPPGMEDDMSDSHVAMETNKIAATVNSPTVHDDVTVDDVTVDDKTSVTDVETRFGNNPAPFAKSCSISGGERNVENNKHDAVMTSRRITRSMQQKLSSNQNDGSSQLLDLLSPSATMDISMMTGETRKRKIPAPATRKKKKSRKDVEASRVYMKARAIEIQREKEKRQYDALIPCAYFKKHGECHYGDECRFSHNVQIEKRMDCCKFYIVGACINGDKCLYYHHEWPCKFFHSKGYCKAGDECKFSHAEITNEEMKKVFMDQVAYQDSMRNMDQNVTQGAPYIPTNQAPKQTEGIEDGLEKNKLGQEIITKHNVEDQSKKEEENKTEGFQFPSLYYELP